MSNQNVIKIYNKPIISGGHFTWYEYCLLREWGTMAPLTAEERDRVVFLFTQIEKLIRIPIDRPLIIQSGARTQKYTTYLREERKIPAALRSEHLFKRAVDIATPRGMTHKQFYQFCHERWPGRMELERYTRGATEKLGWVHLDTLNWGKWERFVP